MKQLTFGDSAFPYVGSDDDGDAGMRLRDWFGGMALQGLLARYDHQATAQEDHHWHPGDVSRAAYEYADAMMEERAKDRQD